MHPQLEHQLLLSRRQFFGSSGLRLGGVAMAMMAGRLAAVDAQVPSPRMHPPLPELPHFAAKAKAIIYLHMNGGPAQLDTWDYKPKLGEFFDKDLPDSIRNGQRITTMTSGQARFPVAPSMFKFEQSGGLPTRPRYRPCPVLAQASIPRRLTKRATVSGRSR